MHASCCIQCRPRPPRWQSYVWWRRPSTADRCVDALQLRDHVHIARMLSASAAAASTAQADLLSSPLPTSSHVAASAAQSESATAIGSQDERFNASAAVQEMFRRHNTSLPDLQGQVPTHIPISPGCGL